jgi:hypothetical protein
MLQKYLFMWRTNQIPKNNALCRIPPVLLFGIAFAFVESSVVIYLRQLLHYSAAQMLTAPKVFLNLGFITFLSGNLPVFPDPAIARIEMIREAATIIMLVMFAWTAAGSIKQKIGIFWVAFAVWDIFYYVFLHILIGWPAGIMDSDIFFLLPVPWVGPVITPIVICLILFAVGVRLINTGGT